MPAALRTFIEPVCRNPIELSQKSLLTQPAGQPDQVTDRKMPSCDAPRKTELKGTNQSKPDVTTKII